MRESLYWPVITVIPYQQMETELWPYRARKEPEQRSSDFRPYRHEQPLYRVALAHQSEPTERKLRCPCCQASLRLHGQGPTLNANIQG
jgi:hypothetical protein